MKKLTNYITEKLKISNNSNLCSYYPKTRDELKDLITQLIKERGNEADLNDINVSKITDIHELFAFSDFNGDISGWDVSNVTDMRLMFFRSKFKGDISDWNVSNVKAMRNMFEKSDFNQDISKWKVNKKCDTLDMFNHCPLQNNPPAWYEKTN